MQLTKLRQLVLQLMPVRRLAILVLRHLQRAEAPGGK